MTTVVDFFEEAHEHESLQKQGVQVAKEASGLFPFVSGMLCLLVLQCCLRVLFLAMGIYQIYLWTQYEDDFCEEKLATFCLINGIGLVVWALGGLLHLSKDQKSSQCICDSSLGIFFIALSIWGIVLLANIDRHRHVCPSQLYDFVFGYFMATAAISSLCILILCLIASAACVTTCASCILR